MSVLFIGCMVSMWVVSARLSYIYRMHGAYVGSSGTSALYTGSMVPMWGVAVGLSNI